MRIAVLIKREEFQQFFRKRENVLGVRIFVVCTYHIY